MSTGIQTTPKRESDGTVLIIMKDGIVEEVISDLQLDVQVSSVVQEGYRSFPSRPLWEYVRKVTAKLMLEGGE